MTANTGTIPSIVVTNCDGQIIDEDKKTALKLAFLSSETKRWQAIGGLYLMDISGKIPINLSISVKALEESLEGLKFGKDIDQMSQQYIDLRDKVKQVTKDLCNHPIISTETMDAALGILRGGRSFAEWERIFRQAGI
jgi:hypothetical protein